LVRVRKEKFLLSVTSPLEYLRDPMIEQFNDHHATTC